jgi:hypothetical protein
MERKFITNELIKVANALDEMGLNKEANSLDKIARKIVVSETTLYGYKSDINAYKAYFIPGIRDNDQDYKQKATDIFNAVMKDRSGMYNDRQKEAFRDQAESIRNLVYGNFDIETSNDNLARYMETSPYFPNSNGVIFGTADIGEFTNYWINQIQPKFNINNPNIAKWLSSKFLIYKKQILTNNAKEEADKKASEPSWWEKTFGGKK